jgi:GT2 family glycosyltransferase
MKTSVVIPTFNGSRTLGEQLAALARENAADRLEVVISDNGSADSTRSLAYAFKPHLPGLVLVDSSSSKGVAHARNAGASAATGDVILFCDQDDVVGSGWLAAMEAALTDHPVVAARLDHRRLNPGWTIEFFGEPQSTGLADTAPRFLPYAWGGTIGVRRDLHLRIGGFDESFGQGGEDNDYCYRLHLAGTDITFVPEAVVHYRHRQMQAEIFDQARGYGRASAMIFQRYRGRGLRRPSLVRSAGAWISLPLLAPVRVWSRGGRARSVSRLGERLGRIQGSIENGVFFP